MSISFNLMPAQDAAKFIAEAAAKNIQGHIKNELYRLVEPILEAASRDLARQLLITCETQMQHRDAKIEVLLSFKENPLERFPK